ncbi:MAG: histone deacetylase family protein [Firmicutes bacterium]|nr:histone deacetylase family protein [Bacillota bacterium]
MKVVFHRSFLEMYVGDPAASYGRLDHALDLVRRKYPLFEPSPSTEKDVLLVHSRSHLESVRREDAVFSMALLAAGATITAAEISWGGEAAFALCRPPGHHASPDSSWGFCYFNNIAIAVQKLFQQGKIEKALIIDFDLHYGDGTSNIFADNPAVSYWHVWGRERVSFLQNLKGYLKDMQTDLVAVSAGFDRHKQDWGGMLTTADYGAIGTILGDFARERCQGRVFAALEGGYNPRTLGDSTLAFLDGLAGQALDDRTE